MRKVLFLLTLLGLFATQSNAQFTVPWVPSGLWGVPQVITGANNTVTVTPILTPPATNMYSQQFVCGVGPYLIGGLRADGYNFVWNLGATKIQLEFADVHDDDTVVIGINGTTYTLTGTNLSPSTTCPNPNTVVVSGGSLTSSGTPFGAGTAITVDINVQPANITSLSVFHGRKNPNSGGVIFSVKFWEDNCDPALTTLTANSPCIGDDLNLSITNLPNTTFTWTHLTSTWTATGASVTRPNVTVLDGGTYEVTIARQGCPSYTKQVFVSTLNDPGTPLISGKSPVCKGGNDTLVMQAQLIGGGDYYWYGPNGFTATGDKLYLNSVQPFQAGKYYGYAVTLDGCVSDTVSIDVSLHSDMTASFEHDVLLGCYQDTINFINTSIYDSVGGAPDFQPDTLRWYVTLNGQPFNLIRQGSKNQKSFSYYIPFDKHDVNPRNYELRLMLNNEDCADSMIVLEVLDHPLKAEFEVDDDSICQGATTITFNNKSSAATIGTHSYEWHFKDGSPVEYLYNAQHLYTLAGIYEAQLVLINYLGKTSRSDSNGCRDTFTKIIFVDSTGPISYTVSDSVICPGDNVDFRGTFSEIGNIGLLWDFKDGSNQHVDERNTSYAFERPGTYDVEFSAFNRVCPTAVITRPIVVKPAPLIDLGPDTSICPNGEPVVLADSINFANMDANWKWNNNVRDTNHRILVRHPGVYSATVEIDGCSTTDSVVVEKNCFINLPNVFAPGSGGNNGYFLPRQLLSRGVTKFSMTIFDRWGQVVFESASLNGRGWDGNFNGEPQPMGVYVYLISVSFENNTSETYQGNVTLLR